MEKMFISNQKEQKQKKREINSAKGFLKKEVQRLNMGKICTELTMELMLLATDCN